MTEAQMAVRIQEIFCGAQDGLLTAADVIEQAADIGAETQDWGAAFAAATAVLQIQEVPV